MNNVLFAAIGLLCLFTIGFVVVNTDHNFVVYKAQAVPEKAPSDTLTPKRYIEDRKQRNAWKPVEVAPTVPKKAKPAVEKPATEVK